MRELFVGYLPAMPPGIARLIRKTTGCLLLGVVLIACALVASQHRFPSSAFEFDTVRDFEGVLEEKPYPALVVARPGIQDINNQFSRYLLVGVGKHGANQDISGFAGRDVKLRGKLIYRNNQTLVEVMPGSVAEIHGTLNTTPVVSTIGPVTLTGEIVDSKCYFGVMNPGEGKVHRDCAIRCLSGGIPPALISRDSYGHTVVYLLANSDGSRVPRDWAAERAARPVAISGQLVKSGDTLILHADLNTFHVLR